MSERELIAELEQVRREAERERQETEQIHQIRLSLIQQVKDLRAELDEARRENEALAKALDRLAHEFEPGPRNGPLFCEDCTQMAVTKVHQTSTTVRRALTGAEGGDSGGE